MGGGGGDGVRARDRGAVKSRTMDLSNHLPSSTSVGRGSSPMMSLPLSLSLSLPPQQQQQQRRRKSSGAVRQRTSWSGEDDDDGDNGGGYVEDPPRQRQSGSWETPQDEQRRQQHYRQQQQQQDREIDTDGGGDGISATAGKGTGGSSLPPLSARGAATESGRGNSSSSSSHAQHGRQHRSTRESEASNHRDATNHGDAPSHRDASSHRVSFGSGGEGGGGGNNRDNFDRNHSRDYGEEQKSPRGNAGTSSSAHGGSTSLPSSKGRSVSPRSGSIDDGGGKGKGDRGRRSWGGWGPACQGHASDEEDDRRDSCLLPPSPRGALPRGVPREAGNSRQGDGQKGAAFSSLASPSRTRGDDAGGHSHVSCFHVAHPAWRFFLPLQRVSNTSSK